MSPLTAVDWYVACLLDRITGKQVRGLGEAKAGYQRATAQIATAEDLLRDVALCGVSFEDPRMDYVEVQIDQKTWEAVAAYDTASAALPND